MAALSSFSFSLSAALSFSLSRSRSLSFSVMRRVRCSSSSVVRRSSSRSSSLSCSSSSRRSSSAAVSFCKSTTGRHAFSSERCCASASSNSLSTSLRCASRFAILAASRWSHAALRLIPANSVINAIRRRERSSKRAGSRSISTRTDAAASSIRSIALSGRCRSGKCLSLKRAAAARAESLTQMPWCFSKRRLRPRRIETVSSTDGAANVTLWKRLSKAGSFSMNRRNLSAVVAPTHLIRPSAKSGFKSAEASKTPPPC
mmetsp:Transcript_25208/g.45740  ORF Transcript_25208/g.45740 Transcript_25208/m.45740 type:complete len:259 (+) Transcript_25208:355-1131(+)